MSAMPPKAADDFPIHKSSTFTLPSSVTLMFAMNDSPLMCSFEGFGDLQGEFQRLFNGNSPTRPGPQAADSTFGR